MCVTRTYLFFCVLDYVHNNRLNYPIITVVVYLYVDVLCRRSSTMKATVQVSTRPAHKAMCYPATNHNKSAKLKLRPQKSTQHKSKALIVFFDPYDLLHPCVF